MASHEAVELLRRSKAEFDQLVVEVADAAWALRPDDGRWSVGDVAEHLLRTELWFLKKAQEAIANDPDPARLQATEGKTEHIEKVMLDRTTRFTSPEGGRPSGTMSREKALGRFDRARARTLSFAESADESALHHGTADHFSELFGTMTGYQWLVYAAHHNERHNRQIAEIISAT